MTIYYQTYTLDEVLEIAAQAGLPPGTPFMQIVPEGYFVFYDASAVLAAYPQFANMTAAERNEHFKTNKTGVLLDNLLKPIIEMVQTEGGTIKITTPGEETGGGEGTTPGGATYTISPADYLQIDKAFINRNYRRGSLVAPSGEILTFTNLHNAATIDVTLTAGRGYSATPPAFSVAPGQTARVQISFDAAGLETLVDGLNSAALDVVATTGYTQYVPPLPPPPLPPPPKPLPPIIPPTDMPPRIPDEGEPWEEIITPPGGPIELPPIPEQLPPPPEPQPPTGGGEFTEVEDGAQEKPTRTERIRTGLTSIWDS